MVTLEKKTLSYIAMSLFAKNFEILDRCMKALSHVTVVAWKSFTSQQESLATLHCLRIVKPYSYVEFRDSIPLSEIVTSQTKEKTM